MAVAGKETSSLRLLKKRTTVWSGLSLAAASASLTTWNEIVAVSSLAMRTGLSSAAGYLALYVVGPRPLSLLPRTTTLTLLSTGTSSCPASACCFPAFCAVAADVAIAIRAAATSTRSRASAAVARCGRR